MKISTLVILSDTEALIFIYVFGLRVGLITSLLFLKVMSTSTTPLPKPSVFLTELLATLSALSNPSFSETNAALSTTTTRDIAKPFLLTLHALFPSTLLPALDLLDRQLVSRHVLAERPETLSIGLGPTIGVTASQTPSGRDSLSDEFAINPDVSNESPVAEASPIGNRGPDPPPVSKGVTTYQISTTPRHTYCVKSSEWRHSAKQRHYSGYSTGAGGLYNSDKSYEVRPWAWSCTCAAFAFAAHNHEVGNDTGYELHDDDDDKGMLGIENAVRGRYSEDGDRREEEIDGAEQADGKRWGGLMGFYGDREGRRGDAPLCKHLLACVLAEWWDEARDLVEVKHVGREEMAGWAAGWGG